MVKRAQTVASRYLRLPDGTTWPEPWPNDPDADSLEWRLRYNHTFAPMSRQDQLNAASVCAAYAQLVALPRRRREQIIAAIRAQRPVNR